MSMYKRDPNAPIVVHVEEHSTDKKVELLEAKVARLSEMVLRLQAELEATRRAGRRQATDINNITTAVRNIR